MARLFLEKLIKATPDHVWSVIKDLDRQASWMVDVRDLKVTSEQSEGVGAVIEVRSELFGLPLIHDVMEITKWEPARRMNVVHRGQFSGTGSFVLEPVQGQTLFSWIEEFQPPLGLLGELVFNYIVKPHLTSVFGRSMENVRRLAEASANAAASA